MYKKNLFLIIATCCFNIANAQNFLKKFSSVGPLTSYNNLLIFPADDGVHGVELWKSDGTVEGTVLVKDIAPGYASATVGSLVVYKNKVYFSANDGVNGAELWSSDGTAAGTKMVKDINPARIGNNGSGPANLTVVNGVIVFTGTDSDSTPTSAIFKTDGTAAGTVRLNELDYFGSGQLTLVKNNVYFTRDGNRSLWKTDGTVAGTKQVMVDDYYTIDALRAVDDGLVFITNTSYRQSIRLYYMKSDDKPVLLHQYDAVIYGTNDIDNITAAGSGFFFSIRTVDSQDNGLDYLWHSDGTPNGTVSIKSFDWKRYLSGSQMQNFTSYNNKLYFAATSSFALWSSDGTAGGTAKASESIVNTLVRSTVSNNKLYYSSAGNLWAVDASGAAKTQSGTNLSPAYLFDLNNTLYFTVSGQNNITSGLWINQPGPTLSVTADYSAVSSGEKLSLSSKVDSSVVRTFTLKNGGSSDLVLSEISVAGTPFYVNGKPAQVIQAGQQSTFKLTYLPGKETEDKGKLLIRSNDSYQGDFVLDLAGSSIGKTNITKQQPNDGLLKLIDFSDTTAQIKLSAKEIDENKPAATTIGTFSAGTGTPPFSYQLVTGTGSADNNSFKVEGDALKSNKVFNYANKSTYTIRVKASNGTTNYEQVFAVSISQANAAIAPANCNATVQNMAYLLSGVDFAGSRIVAVGENGKILKSDNNGVSWSVSNSGTQMSLNKVQFTSDRIGFASYVNNYQSILLKTEDAGDNWFPLDVTDQIIKNTYFVTDNIGYAFTEQSLFKTDDGGHSWKKNTSTGFSSINSAYFINEQTGFVCGTDLSLFRTKDGGDTWTRITTLPLGQYTNLSKVVFTGAKNGYIVSSAGDVLKTTDGGDNWIRVSVLPSSYITDMYFTDDNTGYALAGYGGSELYKTVNGGVTWTTDLQAGFSALLGIKFNKQKTIGVTVGTGKSLGSTSALGRAIWVKNGNNNWENVSKLSTNDDFYSVSFTDNKTGYVFGKYNSVKTVDGGVTWADMPLSGTYGLRSSTFIKNTGYAADLVDLYKTTDSGNSWKKIVAGESPDQIRSVYFLNADTGFYTTFSGSGLIVKTTDGGAHWIKTQISTFDFISKIAFVNSKTGFGVGSQGVIVKTTDGGDTWKTIAKNEEYWLTSIHIFDENNIIVGGLKGVLLKSKDGGATWQINRSPIVSDISNINFVDAKHGYAFAGNYGNSYNTIYETIDGGANWTYFAYVDENTGVSSFGGTVYLAGNGGSISKIEAPAVSSQIGYVKGEMSVIEKVKNQYTVAVNPGTICKWFTTGDAKITTSGNTAIVQWNAPGKYQLSVSASNNCGGGATRTIDVLVDTALKTKIIGPDTVLAHARNITYTADIHANSTYSWAVSGDSTYTVTGNKITVNWGVAGGGKVEVIETQESTSIKTSAIVNVKINNGPFSLPQTNFKVKATAESCRESNNGEILISAYQKLNYTATVEVDNVNKIFPFKESVSIKNLKAGTYHLCLTATDHPGYQQCYDVVISEPKDLAVFATLNKPDRTVNLALSGGTNYQINLNGTTYNTTANNITLELAGGNNSLRVTTDKDCQGIFNQQYVLSEHVVAYPNPFVNKVSLMLSTRNAKKAKVEIRDINGRSVYSGTPDIQYNQVYLNLESLHSGVFVLKLMLDDKESVIKIWKR